jgi:hypothetical protein
MMRTTFDKLKHILNPAPILAGIIVLVLALGACGLFDFLPDMGAVSKMEEVYRIDPNDTEAPGQVTNVSIVATGDAAALYWTNPTATDFAGVKIEWSPEGGDQPLYTDRVVETAVAHGLNSNVMYTFTITALDVNANGNPYTHQPVRTNPGTDIMPPKDVVGLEHRNLGMNRLTLAWNLSQPADQDLMHFEIMWRPTTSMSQPQTVPVGTNAFDLTDLVRDTEYTFIVKAVDQSGNKSIGVPHPVRTLASDPTLPALPEVTNFTAVPTGETSVALTWTDPTTEPAYNRVEISWTPNPPTTPVVVQKGVQAAAISGLLPGTAYDFLIQSLATDGRKSAGVTRAVTTFVAPPRNGLVGEWLFNDAASGTALDTNGNIAPNNGSVMAGISAAQDRFNMPSKAYMFNGGPYSINTTFASGFPNGVTVSIWSYSLNNMAMDQTLVSCNPSFTLYKGNGANNLYAAVTNTTSTTYYPFGPNDSFPVNAWVHFVLRVDQSGSVAIFKNGSFLVGSAITMSVSSSTSLSIGANAATMPWTGTLDDVRIYNRPLTDAEITLLYHEGGWAP